MIIAVVGSGGKTTLIRRLAAMYRQQGKRVLVTTTTHMYREADTLLTDDPAEIGDRLDACGYAMAGLPAGEKIRALSGPAYAEACRRADVVLVEADGSKGRPLKFPNSREPVIPDNADEILVVCGLNALGKQAGAVCHRMELVTACLGIGDDTCITQDHVRRLLWEGYLIPLKRNCPGKKITLCPRHDGSASQKEAAQALIREAEAFFATE